MIQGFSFSNSGFAGAAGVKFLATSDPLFLAKVLYKRRSSTELDPAVRHPGADEALTMPLWRFERIVAAGTLSLIGNTTSEFPTALRTSESEEKTKATTPPILVADPAIWVGERVGPRKKASWLYRNGRIAPLVQAGQRCHLGSTLP